MVDLNEIAMTAEQKLELWANAELASGRMAIVGEHRGNWIYSGARHRVFFSCLVDIGVVVAPEFNLIFPVIDEALAKRDARRAECLDAEN